MTQWKNLELISVRKRLSFSKLERDQKRERKGTNWLVVLIMKRGREEGREADEEENEKYKQKGSKLSLLLIKMSIENQESHRNNKKVMKHFK